MGFLGALAQRSRFARVHGTADPFRKGLLGGGNAPLVGVLMVAVGCGREGANLEEGTCARERALIELCGALAGTFDYERGFRGGARGEQRYARVRGGPA